MIRFQYCADFSICHHVMTDHYPGTIKQFRKEKVDEIERKGWYLIGFAFCRSKTQPDSELNWRI